MTRHLLTFTGAVLLATSLQAQAPTPATQPVRPPDRRPAGEPPPLPAPERGGDDERAFPGRSTPEDGDPEVGTLVLKGCLERVDARAFRLRPVRGDQATVTADVQLQGAVETLRPHVGSVVEVRGTYEQGTPASSKAFFSVTRVTKRPGTCETS